MSRSLRELDGRRPERRVGRAIAVAAAATMLASACTPEDARGEAPKKAPPAALVSVAEARAGQLRDQWTFLGNARSKMRAELAAGASGEVTEVNAREGDRVRRGATLVSVDPGLVGAQVAAARAARDQAAEQLAQAQRELQRFEQLDRASLAELELEQARSRVAQAIATLAAREGDYAETAARYQRHRVRAPFDGIVAMRHVDPGDWVDPGVRVLELVSVGELEVLVDGPATLFGRVRAGDEAVVLGRAGETVAAVIAGLVPALDPVSRTLRIRLTVADSPSWLLPGAPVDVRFSVDLSGQGVVVPRDALVRDAGGLKVFAIRDEQAHSLPVDVLATSQSEVLVAAREDGDLTVGTAVVVRGNERLRPGQAVRVVE